jgi:hypothetical protein
LIRLGSLGLDDKLSKLSKTAAWPLFSGTASRVVLTGGGFALPGALGSLAAGARVKAAANRRPHLDPRRSWSLIVVFPVSSA